MHALNPWWTDQEAIHEDKKIKEWEDSAIKYDPMLRRDIAYDFDPSNTVVYTLRGPRQVGKTTMIKLQIRDFLASGISPWNILYYSLDIANAPQDVVDLVETYLSISAKMRESGRCYLFLDEVSSVPDWQKGIKWLVDNGMLKNCTVMVTGSQALNLVNAAERLPGRRGIIEGSHDKILLPMKFAEYAALMNEKLEAAIDRNGLLSLKNRTDIFKKLTAGEVDERLDKLSEYQHYIDGAFDEYMITGGTPKVVDEKIKTNAISQNVYDIYLEGIAGSWKSLGKNETLLRQFLGAVIKSLASHASWSSLSAEAALGSPNTAADYAHTLRGLLVMSIMHQYGEEKKIPLIKKDKKFYFCDPFFTHTFNGWLSPAKSFEAGLQYLEDDANRGRIAEGIVADHLVRLAFSMSEKKQIFDSSSHVFYWKDEKNREVDFVLYDRGAIEVPIEVKFRSKVNLKELASMVSFLNKTGNETGLVLSKSLLDVRTDYVIIPASLFLLLA